MCVCARVYVCGSVCVSVTKSVYICVSLRLFVLVIFFVCVKVQDTCDVSRNVLCIFSVLQSSPAYSSESPSDAIQPAHIREAIRRYSHKIAPLSLFSVRLFIIPAPRSHFNSLNRWNCSEQLVVCVIFLIKVTEFCWRIK